MNILLTGGAGYIGSNVANRLIDFKHNVFIIDDLSTGNKSLVPKKAKFHKCNINDIKKVELIIKQNQFDAVMHFAGFIQVEESVKFPKKYLINNTENSKILFETCVKNNLNNFIFSSTAAIYGNKKENHISENAKLNPLNPYGESKFKTEKYLLENIKNLNFIILRYFNVAGADPKLRSGQISKKSTHLIKKASEVVAGKRKSITIYGNDYNTFDGTAVRDYIHVSDLADIHIKCLEFLIEKKQSEIFNCGYGRGFSVKEVLNTFNKISEKKLNIKYGPRRQGDAEILISNVEKIKQMIDWTPKYNKLDYIIKTSIDWELKLLNDSIS